MSVRPSADELLFEANLLEGSERSSFLRQACAGDRPLLEEVESLLSSLEGSGGFLETPPVLTFVSSDHDRRNEAGDRSGERVGAYRLVELLGQGGMGTVYLAERADGAFEKRVAVKLIRKGLLAGELERRFLTERQALAELEHPNIARLLDGGASDDGEPFLVMEHVEGGAPLDRACRERALSVDQRLRLFLDVCDAVQHAHGKLVLHRDIKPTNVLLDGDGRVKLVDFGIAKLLGSEDPEGGVVPAAHGDQTVAGERALTPAYASPEQREGRPVTTASDVYSLGVLLHVLLVERLPDEGQGFPDGDLAWILRRALAEEPGERYATPEQLSSDVRRHLESSPVSAAPDSVRYRGVLLYRRNRVAVLVATLLVATLVTATATSTRSYFAARAAREVAEAERVAAETERATALQVSDFLESVLGSIDPNVAQGRDVSVLAEVIDRAAARIPAELGDQPEVAIALHSTLGEAYERIARFEAAEEQMRLAVEVGRRLGGEALAETLVGLGSLLTSLSRDDQAEPVLREAVDIARELSDGGGLVHAAALTALGRSLEKQAQGEEAESAHRRALEIRRRHLDGDHPAVASSLDLLGWLLATTDRSPEAEPLLREAVENRRHHVESAPLPLAGSLGHLAYALRQQGRYDEAQALYEEAVGLARRLLGDEHPELGTQLSTLASLHEDRGALEVAEAHYLEALAIQRRAYGERHREVGTTLNNLGGLQRKMGRFEEARRTLGEARETYAAVLGEDHPWTTIADGNLVQVLLEEGDWEAAERAATSYLVAARRFWPEEHWRIAAFENIRGACQMALGDLAGAEPILRASFERLDAALGREHRFIQDAIGRLIELYEQTGRPELAAELRALRTSSDIASR